MISFLKKKKKKPDFFFYFDICEWIWNLTVNMFNYICWMLYEYTLSWNDYLIAFL